MASNSPSTAGKRKVKRSSQPHDKSTPQTSTKTRHPSAIMNVASREEVSQHALLTSIEGGTFEDVKFYTFSRRTQSGLADKPRALFGNSVLIRKTSSYFDYGTYRPYPSRNTHLTVFASAH